MKKPLPLPPQKRLVELFDYDPLTGNFTQKIKTSSSGMPGMIAGAQMTNGYISIAVDKKRYLAHRLAWMIVHGGDPMIEVDHRNRVRSDNRIANLRDASRKDNSGNASMQSNNTSGAKGVCWDKSRSKWIVHIKISGRQKFLGRYASREDASSAYDRAAIAHFGSFAATNTEFTPCPI